MKEFRTDISQADALFFDLDGTIIDSDPLHRVAFAEILEPAGHHVTVEFFDRHIHGKKVADIFAALMPGQDPFLLAERKEEIFRKLLARSDIPCTPGLIELLATTEGSGIPCAVATNGSFENAIAALEKLNIRGSFAAIVAAPQVASGKPAPDVYLEAAKLVGADPGRSIAFEDSVPGIISAKSAGCMVVGLTTTLSTESIIANGANSAINDFTDLDLSSLDQGPTPSDSGGL